MIAFFYDLLLLIPFSLAVTSFAAPYFLPEESGLFWLLPVFLTLIFMICLKAFKMRGRSVLLGGLAAVFCGILLFVPAEDREAFFLDNRFVFLMILLTAACFFAGLLLNRFRILRAIAAVSGLVLLLVMLFLKEHLSKLTVCMVFLYGLLVLADEIQRHSKKEGDTDPKKHLLFVSPFLLAIFLVTAFLKTPDKPYDWAFVKNIVKSLQSSLIRLSESLFPETGWDSKQPMIGFSDRGEFGGDLSKAEHTVMVLDVITGKQPYLYLAGRVFDSFDGQSWNKTDFDPVFERGLDTLETYSAAEGSEDLVKKAGFRMKYEDMSTKDFFAPAKLAPGRNTNGLIPEGADLSFQDQETPREPVSVFYYQTNQDHEEFRDFLEKQHVVTEEQWEKTCYELGLLEARGYSYKDYLSYKERLEEIYLPKTTLSEEVSAVLSDALEGADTDYEKLRRLEGLFRNFRYTEKPGNLPSDLKDASDFLDYFLLEKKEGYCSYYATAFVLLARSLGIPARYVQGYRVPNGNKMKIEVSSSYAHAWAEAYLPGTGWFVFEPTPGYRMTTSWLTEADNEKTSAELAEMNALEPLPEPALPAEPEEPVQKAPVIRLAWYQIAAPCGLGLLFILLIYVIDRLLKKRRYEKKNEGEKCRFLCQRSLALLKRRNYPRKEEETLTEYQNRIGTEVPTDCLSFCGIYEEMLYGTREIGAEERLLLEENTEKIRKLKKKKTKQRSISIGAWNNKDPAGACASAGQK